MSGAWRWWLGGKRKPQPPKPEPKPEPPPVLSPLAQAAREYEAAVLRQNEAERVMNSARWELDYSRDLNKRAKARVTYTEAMREYESAMADVITTGDRFEKLGGHID